MAIDSETKRFSILNAGSFTPGKLFLPSEPDGNDMDTKPERAFLLWRYSGIDAGDPVGGGVNPNPSASTQRDVQTIANRAFDETNNILNTTTV